MGDSYKCAMCGGEFFKSRSDEEAVAEMVGFFGDVPLDECDIICDGCFQDINPADNPELVANTRKKLGTD